MFATLATSRTGLALFLCFHVLLHISSKYFLDRLTMLGLFDQKLGTAPLAMRRCTSLLSNIIMQIGVGAEVNLYSKNWVFVKSRVIFCIACLSSGSSVMILIFTPLFIAFLKCCKW